MNQPILRIQHQGYAHTLATYLTSQGYPARSEPVGDNEYEISVAPGQDMDEVKAICETFLQEPAHPRYQQAAWQSGEQVKMSFGQGNTMGTLMDNARHAPFTAIILVLCSLIYGLSWVGLFPQFYHTLTMQPLPQLVESGQWWRLLGPVFLHFSALHFIFNLLWWAMLGAQIERRLGFFALLMVFVVSGMVSNIAQVMVSGPNFGGLSGVVYAVLGFVWWLGWLRPGWGLGLPRSVVGFMLIWLVIGYADLLWVEMANTAHLAGLICGCALAGVLALGARRQPA